MEKSILFPMQLNLQLFAEGTGTGSVGGGTGAEGAKGATATAAMSQTSGENTPAAEVNTNDRTAKFDELIKGEYKDLYDAKVQDTIQKRLKSTKETVDRYNALSPTLEILAKKYGVDATNIEALNKAIEDDDSYFEEEALEKGITVQQLKEIRKMERENADLKRQMAERERQEQAGKQYAQWMEQEKQTKALYPSFNLRAEMQNPQFQRLLGSGIDVKTAFEVLHKDEIIPAAMQYTAKTVEQKLTNKIIANGQRPSENGISSQGASLTKSDVSQLSKAERLDLIRRARQGEKISF